MPPSPLILGVIHLLPLPGSPRTSQGVAAVLTRALADARAIIDGGADGFIVENIGDAPFFAQTVEPYTVAIMTRISVALRSAHPAALIGVNVLRNDAIAALSVATAAEADWIRVNVHVGAMVTDQGVIQGEARRTLLERNRLNSSVKIAADVMVKHASPLGTPDAKQMAKDTWSRALADALIISGAGTGAPIDLDELRGVRAAVPKAPLWAGSGITPQNARDYRALLDGFIVGTTLHQNADLERPVERARVEAICRALRE